MRAATLAPWAVSLPERAGISRLGHVREALRAPPEVKREEDDPEQADDTERHVDRRRELLERLLPVVAEQAEDRGPDDPAGCVRDEEAAPLHLPHTGEKGGVGAEQRHEASEEDDPGAVAVEDVARDLEVALPHATFVPVLEEQPVAAALADRVADVVADDRAGRR